MLPIKPTPMVKINIFFQIINILPRNIFEKIVKQYEADKYSKKINSWTHLVSLLFCHFGQAGSVHDISNGLRSITGNIVHLGCSQASSKSTIAYVNEHRTYKLFETFYCEWVAYWDEKNRNKLIFLTNNFSWTASTVAKVYIQHWEIETFFWGL
ncbi:MAG: DUF4372 domain-containing protein [Bacteroidales bacterium]|nr:DUF4372 domain-containing protein [Bacteroidales bacterium]